ncbi:hypothetical protein OG339_48895 (plasmid) [Streptosporangium sp. NBC_01495]|uniref:hypothetical protein n=1 Tax=Streptosporangium sp. NBC_01495 TaxID=2903899 RepID=UPI002E2EA9E7|nr:hypothetical protein [Streptosporangium sp. NBC_01495]
MASRSTQIHRLAAELETITGVVVDAAYDERGRHWDLHYSNGPTQASMQAHLAKLTTKAGLDIALFVVRRVVQDNALAVQAVRYLRTTRAEDPYPSVATLSWAIEEAAHDTDHPERPLDDREAALAQRLLATEGHYTNPQILAERLLRSGDGLAALLADDLQQTRPGDPLWAIEYLSTRYAEGAHRAVWQRHLQPMPAREALAAVAADPEATPAARVAALTLTPVVRADLEAELAALDGRELDLITAVRADDASWSTVGAALHLTRQGAAQRASRLTGRITSTTR